MQKPPTHYQRIRSNRHKQLKEALRQSEQRFELAMRGSNDGLWDWNLQTNEAYFSPRWKEILGYTDEELVSHFDEWHKRLHPEDFERVMQEIDAYLEKRIPNYESIHRLQHKDGHYVWLLVRGMALWQEKTGEAIRFIGTYVDLTAQKRAEEVLRESEQYWRTLIEETLTGLVLATLEGLIVKVNPALANLLEYTSDELCNGSMTLQDITPSQYRELDAMQTQLLLTTGRFGPYEKEMIRKDGQPIPVRLSGVVIKRNDKPFLWCNIDDITDQRRAQSAEKLRFKAEMANHAKGTFLANMSHELRTPLNGILGYAQILSNDKRLTPKQQEGIKIIQRSGEYLLSLINDILEFSKIEAGKVELCPTDFHFGSFLKDTVTLFQVRAEQKKISFVFEPLSHFPEIVQGDERRLRQILNNLLGNAFKFTEKGGVTLKVTYHDNQAEFIIEDTGIGIADEEITKIFLPFSQAGSRDYQAQGTGLGLSITKNLIEMMHGELHVSSRVKHGSTFRVTLNLPTVMGLITPLHKEKVITSYRRVNHTNSLVSAQLKLLVVDDKWENRSVLVNLLVPLGFEISEAANGQEGIEKMRAYQPDLILIDLVMPIMDGFTAVRQIRNMPESARTPIIAVSTSVLEHDHQTCFKAGCDAFLNKPIHAGELLELLQTHLELTWTYDEETSESTTTDSAHSDAVPTEDLPSTELPPESLSQLFDLAMKGDIIGILELLDDIEPSSQHSSPFISKIRQWAKNFQEEQICDFLQKFV
ncbi:MAG: hypothetical protein BWK79_04810 [Beggiatoa sp. IS2]|nr:MAG: hypothetical protein BWK79_04810 [Beggiatoa sp. IS2]